MTLQFIDQHLSNPSILQPDLSRLRVRFSDHQVCREEAVAPQQVGLAKVEMDLQFRLWEALLADVPQSFRIFYELIIM